MNIDIVADYIDNLTNSERVKSILSLCIEPYVEPSNLTNDSIKDKVAVERR